METTTEQRGGEEEELSHALCNLAGTYQDAWKREKILAHFHHGGRTHCLSITLPFTITRGKEGG